MVILLFIIFLILPLQANADVGGVDFSMMSDYNIPKFANRTYAEAYAHSVKWNEPIRLAFELRVKDLYRRVLSNEKSETIAEAVASAAEDIRQYRMLKAALDIMNEYKSRGEVGAMVYMSSIPL